MALVLADRVKESSSSTGSGPFVLGGAAAGYQTLLVGIGDGNSSYFAAWDGAAKWLVFRGTFTSAGNSVSVDTVLAQSTGFTGFTGPFQIWGDSPAYLMSPLLQMSASAAGVQVTSKLGIGVAPTNMLDIAQNVNGDTIFTMNNPNAGNAVRTYESISCGGSSNLVVGVLGPGYTLNNFWRPNSSFVISAGTAGLTLGCNATTGPIYFVTKNAEVARLDENGRLLIGATAPLGTTNLLYVANNVAGDSQALVVQNKSNAAGAASGAFVVNDTGVGALIYTYSSTTANAGLSYRANGALFINTGNGGVTYGNNAAAAPIYFMTGNPGVFIAQFDVNGCFGVGVAPATPNNLIEVQKNAPGTGVCIKATNSSNTGYANFLGLNNAGNYFQLIQTGDAYVPGSAIMQPNQTALMAISPNGLALTTYGGPRPIVFGVNAVEVGRFHTNGAFGVGTNNPQYAVEVVQNGNFATFTHMMNGSGGAAAQTGFLMTNNLHDVSIAVTGGGFTPQPFWTADLAYINSASCAGGLALNGTLIKFGINANEVARFGVQGIAIAPAVPGGWAGNAKYACESSGAIQFFLGYSYAGANSSASILDARIDSAPGNYYCFFRYGTGGIGNITTINGTTITINGTSDIRLKKNIKPANNSGKIIDAIKVCQFDWRKNDSHTSYGICAQELNEVFPEAVSPGVDHDDEAKHIPWMTDVTKLVPLLVAEVQALRKRCETLEKRTLH